MPRARSEALSTGQKQQQSGALRVEAAVVIAAVESLYEDRVQPHGRILLKRLGERMAAAVPMPSPDHVPMDAAGLKCLRGRGGGGELVPRIDTAHLRRVCERSRLLRTVPEEAGDYSVFLVGREPNFVDACSEWDCFPEYFWECARAFFAPGQAGEHANLPGGRYACARALQALSPAFLQGRVLGEVCHAVQLAISHKKILGYLDGRIVPYRNCELVVKQQSAKLQQPAWALKKDALPVADLAQARGCLQTILAKGGGVPLPNVKRLFRSQFGYELMETVFGHARLCDLLSSNAFSDICELRLQNSTYAVLPRTQPARVQAKDDEPECWQPAVLRTFIHLEAIEPGAASNRSKSLPRGWKPEIDAASACSLTPKAIRVMHSAREHAKAECSDDETTASEGSPKAWTEFSTSSSSLAGSDDDSMGLDSEVEDENFCSGNAVPCLKGMWHLRTPSPSPSPRLRAAIAVPSCRTPSPSPRYHWRAERPTVSPAPSASSPMPQLPAVMQPLNLCHALGLPSPASPPARPPVLPAGLCTAAATADTFEPPRHSCTEAWADIFD